MRDDFQVPNFGQAPKDTYEQGYFNRVVRNIEVTFTALRAKGQGIFSKLFADSLELTGDLDVGGNLVVDGSVGAVGNLATTGEIASTGLTVFGDSEANNVNAVESVIAGQDVSAGGTIWGDRVEAQTSLKSYGPAFLGATTVTGASTLNGNVAITGNTSVTGNINYTGFRTRNSLYEWETVFDADFTSQTTVPITNLSAYRHLRLIIQAVSDSTLSSIGFQFSADNGSTWLGTANDYNMFLTYQDEATATVNGFYSGTLTKIDSIRTASTGGASALGGHWSMLITEFNQPHHKAWMGDLMIYNNSAIMHARTSGRSGSAATVAAMNALRFIAGSSAMTGHLFIEGKRG